MSSNTKEILRDCANNILRCIDGLVSTNNQSSANEERTQTTTSNTRTTETGNVRSELNRLFSFGPPSASSRSNVQPCSQRKRKYQSTLKLPNTWTHIFVCLGKLIDNETPNQNYKKQLQNAGLGEKKIVFKKNSSSSYFHETLLDNYPRLRDGGGYELLRTQHRSTTRLEPLLPHQSTGYNVLYLKEAIASAKIYIRPLQIDLCLDPLEQNEVKVSKDVGPIEKCIACEKEVPLFTFRQHMNECPGRKVVIDYTSDESSESDINLDQARTYHKQFDLTDSPSVIPTKQLEVSLGNMSDVNGTLTVLKEIFPSMPNEDLKDVFQDNLLDIDSTIDELIRHSSDAEMGKNEMLADRTVQDLLKSIGPTLENTPQRITVSRDHLLTDSVAFFKKRDFDFRSPVKVIFEGEPAVDGGGPRKEYFSLLLQSLVSPSSPIRLFEGRDPFILPMYNIDSIRAGMFKVAGKMITASVLNGGPGFPKFSPVLYDYLVASSTETDDVLSRISKDDVVDWDILEAIRKIDNSKTMEDIQLVLPEVQNLLIDSGFTKVLNLTTKLEAITTLCSHSVIFSRKAAIDQLALGLKPLLDVSRCHHEEMRSIFVYDPAKQKIDAAQFKSLIEFENVDDQLKDMFLKYIETEEDKLADLLMFCTGTNQIPPLGFHEPSKVTVLQMEPMSGKLPNANTCPQELELPSHQCYELFKQSMDCALSNQSMGFGVI